VALLLLNFQGVRSLHDSLAKFCADKDHDADNHNRDKDAHAVCTAFSLATDLLLLTCSTPAELLAASVSEESARTNEAPGEFELLVHTLEDVTVPMKCTSPQQLLTSSVMLQSQLRRVHDTNNGDDDGKAASSTAITVDGPYETWQEITYHLTDNAVCDHFIPLLSDGALIAAMRVTAAYKMHSLFARYSIEAGRRLSLANVAMFLDVSLHLNHHWLYAQALQFVTSLDTHTMQTLLRPIRS